MNELLDKFEQDVTEIEAQRHIIDLDAVKPQMDRTFKDGKPKGELTYLPFLDNEAMFSWKRGFLYCITGNPASGKSEFINTLSMLKSVNSGWKWLVYSPESYPTMDYLDTLIHTYHGKSTDPDFSNQMSKKEYDEGFDFVKDHYKLIDFEEMPRVEQIIDIFLHSGCDGIILDPYNSIDDENKGFYDFLKWSLTKFKTMARKNDKAVVIIEHPHGSNSLDESGNPNEPSEYTLNGGKMWHNKCDVIGVVHRPLVHSDPEATNVTFRTRKVKNQKLNGRPSFIEFNFDRAANRYWKFNEKGTKITGFNPINSKTGSLNDWSNFAKIGEKAPF